ncbi:MAG: CHAT domain-containing protein [Deltaproteobacteria bacterium]|nr:CHAT domain-containing protein [Deltaproteobacteria bacterium]
MRPERGARDLPLAAALLASLLATPSTGCHARPASVQDDVPADVSLLGCDAVAEGSPCEVVPGQHLRPFVETPGLEVVEVAVSDGATCILPAPPKPGSPTHQPPTTTATSVAVCVTLRRSSDGRRFVKRLALQPSRRPSWSREATRLRKAGDPASAEVIARQHASDPGMDGARAAALLGRLALARGDTEQGAKLLRDAITRESPFARWSEEADDRFALAYTLATHGRATDEASEVLSAPVLERLPEARARRTYYSAIVAHHAGDPRRGLEHVDAALRQLTTVGLTNEGHDAVELRALILWRIGRAAEAHALLRELDQENAADTPPCTRATRLVNAARTSMAAWEEAGRPSNAASFGPEDARRLAAEALALGDQRCPGGLRRANALLALAEATEALGEPTSAAKLLADARASSERPAPWFRAWWHEIQGRVALAGSSLDVASSELAEALCFAVSPQDRWSLLRQRAAVLERLHRDADAVETYQKAEDELDAIARVVPFGEGRALAASTRYETARRLAGVFERRHDLGRAMGALRRARRRALLSMTLLGRIDTLDGPTRAAVERALDDLRRTRMALDVEATSDWSTPGKERAARLEQQRKREQAGLEALDRALFASGSVTTDLPSLAPEELVLLLDVTAGVLRAFSAHRGVVTLRTTTAPPSLDAPDAAFTRGLVAFLSPLLSTASRVRVLAAGEASRLEVHALDAGQGPLSARVPVVYGLDLDPSGGKKAAEPATAALVVTDPTGDLPGARAEADRVMAMRASRGATSVLLHQSRATARAVLDAAGQADIFHFAGHASGGGHDGRDAALLLADGSRLGVGDILAMTKPPRAVVLSACEGARVENAAVASLGVAQAFLGAGTSEAFAPTRTVADTLALAWSTAIHAELLAGTDVGLAFMRVLRDGSPALRAGDWKAFRALTR